MSLTLCLEADDLATLARLTTSAGLTNEELVRVALDHDEMFVGPIDLDAALDDSANGRTKSADEIHDRLEAKYRAMIVADRAA